MFDIFIADFIASFSFAFSLRIFIGEHLEADCPKRSYGCRAAAHKSILEIRQLPLRKEEEKSATVVTVAPHDGIMKTHLFSRPSLSLFYRCIAVADYGNTQHKGCDIQVVGYFMISVISCPLPFPYLD